MLSRNRTFTGCGTCRSRHVKCDEARPICENCKQQGLACIGYERQLTWASHDGDRTFRRPLFSSRFPCRPIILKRFCLLTSVADAEQDRMTQMTTNGLGKQSASATLSQLENKTESGVGLEGDSFKGPFGVLVLSNEGSIDNKQAELQSDQIESDRLEWDLLWPSIAGDTYTLDGLYNIPEGSYNITIPDSFWSVSTLTSDPQPLPPPFLDPDFDAFTYQPTPLSLTPVPSSLEVSSKCTNIPPQAAELLRYFKEDVISLSFPLKNCRQCPWQTVHLPAAMSAFAELSIHHTTSHTRLSLFYSLLSASCLHKYTRGQSTGDLEISAKRFKEIAKRNLELALNEEVVGPKRAKYKEILIAVLSLVMLSVCIR